MGTITYWFKARHLTPCQDHGFGQVLEHKREDGGRVSHGVGAVGYDESVKNIVANLNLLGEFHPGVKCYVTGIENVLTLKQHVDYLICVP